MTDTNFTCEFCQKQFRREIVFAHHMCEKKSRFLKKDDPIVSKAFRVFQRFFSITNPHAKNIKSYYDFIDSSLFKGFVEFSKYLSEIKPIDTWNYVDYLIKNGVKLKDWSNDRTYHKWVSEIILREDPIVATERGILEIYKWADEKEENPSNFFKKVNTNVATDMILSGRLSPWVVFKSVSGEVLLQRLDTKQLGMVAAHMDYHTWKRKFLVNKEKATIIEELFKEEKI